VTNRVEFETILLRGRPAVLLESDMTEQVNQANAEQAKAFIDNAIESGRKFRTGETALSEVADEAANTLRGSTFTVWMNYAKFWQQGYAGADAQKAWERFVKLVQTRNPDVEKPKATSAKAQTVSVERKAEAAKVAVLTAKPKAELQQQAKVLLEKADAESLKQHAIVTKALKAKVLDEAKAVKAAFTDAKTEARKRITALAWTSKNRELLDKVLAILPAAPAKAVADEADDSDEADEADF